MWITIPIRPCLLFASLYILFTNGKSPYPSLSIEENTIYMTPFVSLSDLEQARGSLVWLERVDAQHIDLDTWQPIPNTSSTLLDINDPHRMYLLEDREGIPTIIPSTRWVPRDGEKDEERYGNTYGVMNSVRVGSRVFTQFGMYCKDPANWDVYHIDTGTWSRCTPSHGPRRSLGNERSCVYPLEGKIIRRSKGGTWLFDPDDERWTQVPKMSQEKIAKRRLGFPQVVGDNLFYTYHVPKQHGQYFAYRERGGWETGTMTSEETLL
ncbi:hypothetical protein KIPB_010212 [Kipferlia bialata]|uniref:Uncharacterized protein n=1 Tax=Kipferlia bialata TaxID=797122 RepID=A0A9K3GLE6_9EUKA|nr:hypothetical protein KIPB_010212 [Kipferlia bialata]|eukprot:g10212.t1